jgi:metallo-beta-lactamase family protein
MKITFLGAAGEVTGSQHLLETDKLRVLLDCGMFQGHRAESRRKNETFRCNPPTLDGMILSHAHTDHCGNLPGLFKAGYRGPVFCTAATADVAAVMLEDSIHIQQEDAKYLRRHLGPDHPPIEPLYEEEHVRMALKHMETLDYGEWHDLAPDFRIRFVDAGHILGSAVTEMEIRERTDWRRVVFTGDLGRRGVPLLRDPQRVPGCDVLITESTYGNRLHAPAEDLKQELAQIIDQTSKRGGRVVIPAFSLGRTQTLLYFLNQLSNAGQLPRVPVYVDSPLSTKITSVYRRHLNVLDAELQRVLRHDKDPFSFPGVRFVASSQESQSLNHMKEPFVVIAASGMCESGRVVHHLKHAAADDRNTLLMIGYQAEHTLGRRIVEKRPFLRIYDHDVPLRAEVKVLNGLSAHADAHDFKWWFEGLAADRGVGQAFIVHGEAAGAQGVASLLTDVCDEPPIIPELYKSYEI